MISCIGLKMVSKYVEVFLGKNHSKCLSYTVECHIYVLQIIDEINKNIEAGEVSLDGVALKGSFYKR